MKKKPFIGYFNYTVLLTHISLLSSVFGIYFAIKQIPEAAVYCLMVSGICDAFDGKVARTKERCRQEERFGIQLDSLSDIVCFGVLPTVIGYTLGMRYWWYILIFFFYVGMALTRLAFFNVTGEDRQDQETGERRKEYTGLPVTSAAIIFPALYILGYFFDWMEFEIIYAAGLLITGVLFISNFKVRKPSGIFMALLIVFGSALLVMMAKGMHYGA
ncbi:MAG: CDP-alcohol phosphatidyltransferase family protein [Firmicutes bacterium]|nr:CDP-alcohol phosphatidyltransferase family protein [Bacillota bacterium]